MQANIYVLLSIATMAGGGDADGGVGMARGGGGGMVVGGCWRGSAHLQQRTLLDRKGRAVGKHAQGKGSPRGGRMPALSAAVN